MSSVFFFGFSILLGFLQIFIGKMQPVEAFLSAFLFAQVGLMGIYDFSRHFYRADRTAETLGFQKGSPFQKELAFAFLAVGVLGLLSPVLQGNFWTAGVLAYATLMLGGGLARFQGANQTEEGIEGKTGADVWLSRIVAPVILLLLLALYNSGVL